MPRSPVVSELYKDKIEIVLDNRQIFYLFFGGSVIVGLVFVLGVMVGRRVEARGRLELPQTQAAVDPLAALDRLAGGAGLSFQGALRNPTAPTSNVANAEISRRDNSATDQDLTGKAVEHIDHAGTAAEGLDDKTTGKAEDKKSSGQKSDDGNLEDKKLDSQSNDKPDKRADAKKADDKKGEEKKPDIKKPDEKKADDRKAEIKKSDDKKPEGKKPDDKKAEAKSKYALQLSSFQVRSEAEAYLSQVKANGFGAYITEAEVDGKTYYRVRIGNYRSLDAANGAKADVDKAMKKSATVMKL